MKYVFLIFVAASMISNSEVFCQRSFDKTIDWKIGAEMPAENGAPALGLAGPVAGVHNDVLIIGGGANFPEGLPWEGGKKKYHDRVLLLKMGEEKMEWLTPVPALWKTTAYGASVSLPDGVLYMGGENEQGISRSVVLLQWNTANHSLDPTNFPDLPEPLTNLMAATDGSTVYIGGGESAAGVSNRFYALDSKHLERGWIQLPGLPEFVTNGILAVQSDGSQDYVYLIGGRRRNDQSLTHFYRTVYAYHPQKKAWEERAPLPEPVAAGTGISIGKEYILLFGGDNGSTYNKTESLLLAIQAETDPERKKNLVDQKNKWQQMHPGFPGTVWVYHTKTDSWSKTDSIPFKTPATTTAIRWKDFIVIPSGEIRAGVRTPQILMGQLKPTAKP